MTPKSDEVRALLDRFRTEAPDAARSLMRDTVRSVVEGLSGERAPGDWLRSRGGVIAVSGGLGLFAAGFLIGRKVHVDCRQVLYTGAAVAAGLAAGWVVASQACRTLDEPDGN